MRIRASLVLLAALVAFDAVRFDAQSPAPRRNVIIFVADGLRRGSVNERDMPALSALRAAGVDFENSYSLFPTYTMANASVIATGHRPGDTGVFSNTIWLGYASFDTGNFGNAAGTSTPILENDQVLADMDEHLQGNLLGEETLLAAARSHGYRTAAIGKLGPSALQDAAALAATGKGYPAALPGIVIDDSTGAGGIPIDDDVRRRMLAAGLPLDAPARSNGFGATSAYNNAYTGDRERAGTLMPNLVQQQWFADVATRVVLPMFEDEAKPFAMLYWSRDPDGTQHYQGDSLGKLSPGINGPTSLRALQNADRNLKQLLDWLDAHPSTKANTDVFVTSDHGFATISRREIDRSGRTAADESARHDYVDANGRVDTVKGTLPPGFLAIDLAIDFGLNLFDADRVTSNAGRSSFRQIRLGSADTWEHPNAGNGLVGASVGKPDGSDARIIVVANGGSDLLYVPDGDPALVRAVCERVLAHDYVGGVYVNDRFGEVPGTLPMSAIGLVGATRVPRPSIVVSFKTFYLDPADLQTGVQITDWSLQEGQGYHGGFGRECTLNTMAAIGPDFKRGFADPEPVSNADIAPTLARLMGFDLAAAGSLTGRIVSEALGGGADPGAPPQTRVMASSPYTGTRTVLYYQELPGAQRYAIAGCRLPQDRVSASPDACR